MLGTFNIPITREEEQISKVIPLYLTNRVDSCTSNFSNKTLKLLEYSINMRLPSGEEKTELCSEFLHAGTIHAGDKESS